MKKSLHLLCLVLFGMSVTSCASIINGTSQSIPITSDPSEASVYLDDSYMGETPLTIKAKRKGTHVLTISKEGYKSEHIRLERVFSGVVAGNILAGGLLGWGVDAVSGAQYRLIPDNVIAKLKPLDLPQAVESTDSSN